MTPSSKSSPIDPIAALEQRFTFRLAEYLTERRSMDAEFSLPGLRGWMLSQKWPDATASRKLECLAVLSWAAICQSEADPDRENEIRHELARQLDYLDGSSNHRPATLDSTMSTRESTYASLRQASEPGSRGRVERGLPRFNVGDKLP